MEINFTIDWLAYTCKPSEQYKPWDYAYPAGVLFTDEKPSHGYAECIGNAAFARIQWNKFRPEMGVHVQYSGSSLNVYNLNGTPKERINKFHIARDDKCTRMDLALDVHDSNLSIRSLYAQLKRGTAITKFKTWNIIDGPAGTTLYLGSRQSEQFIRIYDKAKEQGTDGNWKRIEMELKGDKAKMFAQEVSKHTDFVTAQRTRQAIKALVEFPTATWREIVGDLAIGIASAKEGKTDTIAWLLSLVAPAMGRYIRKYGDNGLTEKFMMVVASFSEGHDETAEQLRE